MPLKRRCGKCGKEYTIVNTEQILAGNTREVPVFCPHEDCLKEDGTVQVPESEFAARTQP